MADVYAGINTADMDDLIVAMYEADCERESIASLETPRWTAHTGLGAQAAAWQDGQYAIRLADGNEFYGFSSEAERDEAAEQFCEDGRDVNEIIDGSRPVRPFLDVDVDLTKFDRPSDEEMDSIGEAMRGCIRALGGDDKVATFGYDNAAKRSRHLIALRCRLADGGACKTFAVAVRQALPEHLRGFVELKGGQRSFGLRIPGCAKGGDASRTLNQVAAEPDADGDYWLQRDSTDKVIGEPTRPAPREFVAPDAAAYDPNVAKLVTLVAAEMPQYGEAVRAPAEGRQDVIVQFEREFPSDCVVCGRVHDKRGAYISINEAGAAFLRCHAAEKTDACIACEGVSPAAEAKGVRKIPIDDFDVLTGDPERINCQYNADGITDTGGDLYISSAWKTGKSTHNAKLVDTLRTRKADAKVLVVTARKSLTAQMVNDLKAVSYTRISGMLDANKVKLSVWQLESLKRISSDTVFDIILVDELTALAEHAYGSSSLNPSGRASMSTLKTLLSIADRIIVSDNDLTSKQVAAAQSVRIGRPARIIRNEYQPWKGVPCTIYTGRVWRKVTIKGEDAVQLVTPIDAVAEKMFEWADAQAELKKDGQPWHGAIVPCHSVKLADRLAKQAMARYGAGLVRLYTGESCDKEKRRDFADAAKAWDGALLVFYTGTVSVGVSANIKHFSDVFAMFISNNAPASASAQMLFRARQVKRLTIAFDGQNTRGLPLTIPELMEWATAAQNRGSIPDEFRHDRSPSITIDSASNPSALEKIIAGFEGQLWANTVLNTMRSANDFVGRISDILTRAGIEITHEGPNKEKPTKKYPTPHSGTLMTSGREKLMAEMVLPVAADIKKNPEKYAPDTCEDLTESEKAGRRAIALAKTYLGVTPEAIAGNEKWVKHYQKSAQQYERLKVACLGDPRQADMAGNAPVTSSAYEACVLSRKCFDALGLRLDATRAWVSRAALEEGAGRVFDEVNKHCLRLYGDSNGGRRAKSAKSLRSLVAAMSATLGYFGARLIPTYANDTDKNKKQNVRGYALVWIWNLPDEADGTEPVAPFPEHPTDTTAALTTVAKVAGAPVPEPKCRAFDLADVYV